MIIYKESGKLRAETYKNIGYFCASIFGLMVINIFVYGENFSTYLGWKGALAIISLYWAYCFVDIGVSILREIDKLSSTERSYDNLKE